MPLHVQTRKFSTICITVEYKYDFINPTPFTVQADGQIKAYADAANGKRYWLYPSGRMRLYELNSKSSKETTMLTEERLGYIIHGTIMDFIKREMQR